MSDSEKWETRAIRALADIRDALANKKQYREPMRRFEHALDRVNSTTRRRLQKAVADIEHAQADRAFEAFAVAAERIRRLKDGFKLGERMARQGRKDLFFPTMAANLGQVSALVKELNKAADDIKANVESLKADFESTDAQSLISEGESIAENLEELMESLSEVKSKLP